MSFGNDPSDYHTFRLGWLKCLIDSYEREHDWDTDEDASATGEMLTEARAIWRELMDAQQAELTARKNVSGPAIFESGVVLPPSDIPF